MEGSIGGSLGSALGASLGLSALGGLSGSLLIVANFLLPGVGAFLGALLGTVLGDLFVDDPKPLGVISIAVVAGLQMSLRSPSFTETFSCGHSPEMGTCG
ncbi:hypothetical protein [Mesorhizobium amorphae]|uniref:hypothetical protein n=1 Tax=Mesorhizobium amorphae TaxID=71433 RepID=UPI00178163D8|nr:hypothetical protein [Mesorhizobium amorphae]